MGFADAARKRPKIPNRINLVLELNRLDVFITGEWSFITHVKDKLKPQKYQWDGNRKAWYKNIDCTDEEARFSQIMKEKTFFDQTFSGLYDPRVFEGIMKVTEVKVQIKPVVRMDTVISTTGMSEKMEKSLMPHQRESVRRFNEQDGTILLAFEMGCLHRDTRLVIQRNGVQYRKTVEELRNMFSNTDTMKDGNTFIRSIDPVTFNIKFQPVEDVFYSGKKNVYTLVFVHNHEEYIIRCTRDHRFMTNDGWKRADGIDPKDSVYIWIPKKKEPSEARLKYISETYIEEKTYDVSVPASECFFANDILVHNSGKTLSAAAIVASSQKSAIVICPKSLMQQWKEELLKWDVAKEHEILLMSGSKKQIVQNLYSGRYRFYIINYEKLAFFYTLFEFKDVLKMLGSKYKDDAIMNLLTSYTIFKKVVADAEIRLLKEHGKTMNEVWKGLTEEEEGLFKWIVSLNHKDFILVYDETYKIKTAKSQLTKSHKHIRKYNWGGLVALSGTPYENNLGEFFNILDFVRPGWMTWWNFVSEFAWEDNFGRYHYKNLAEFNRRASELMYRLTKQDIKKDLPPLVMEWRFSETDKKLHMLTEELIDTVRKKIEETGKGSEIFQLYTIFRVMDSYFEPSNEFCEKYNIEKNKVYENSSKFSTLESVLEEIGDNQVLIFTAFEKTAIWLYEKLKNHHRCRYVSANVQDKETIRDQFLSGDLQIVIATDVWAYGVDAPNIPCVINFDLPLNPAKLAQRINRIYRINSKEGKLVVNLCGDIIEHSVYEILKLKSMNFEVAVEGIEESEITSTLSKKWGFDKIKKQGSQNEN